MLDQTVSSTEEVSTQVEEPTVESTVEQEPLDSKVERLAREQGWNPKEEYSDDPKDWVDAAEFLARGAEFRRRQAFKAEDKIKALEDTMSKFQEHLSRTEKAMYEKAVKEVEERMSKAKAAYDFDSYEQARQEKEKLQNNVPLADQEDLIAQKSFLEANPWYVNPQTESELELKALSLAYENLYISKNPNYKMKDLAAHLTEKMSKELNKRMSNETRSTPAPVAQVGSKTQSAPRPSSNLPHPKFGKLSDGQKQAFLQFQKYVPNFNADSYIDSLEKSGQIK